MCRLWYCNDGSSWHLASSMAYGCKLVISVVPYSSRGTVLSSMNIFYVNRQQPFSFRIDCRSLAVPGCRLRRRLWLNVQSNTRTAGTLSNTPMSEMTASADRSVIMNGCEGNGLILGSLKSGHIRDIEGFHGGSGLPYK